MKITIVTPSYNQANYIERTILSVLDQKYPALEYIIIDGASTDGTIDILKKYEDRLTWISEKDSGQANAINKGLKMATGEIVAFLNSDDTYEPGAISKVADFFRQNPDTKWVYGKCRIINEKDKEIRKPITVYKNLMLKSYGYNKLLSENFISQPATFWKRELHQDIGYLNEGEHFCMDYEFWLRIGKKYPAGVIHSYLANFRYHDDSKSGSVNKDQFRDELRIANGFSTRFSFPIILHTINYYKIITIYQLLNLLKWRK